ncbi:anti-sigma factor [Neobacillus citreus]|uniref:Anti-sigma factor n=1 Tax=Neobacillus citreus TaxID=2833578 RepID=A0A9J6MUH6_9BACI|nr:anti-sigma factor [Neobacillus citreus]MCH6265043.1 anti-sigma factor [Neobacillus citreus]
MPLKVYLPVTLKAEVMNFIFESSINRYDYSHKNERSGPTSHCFDIFLKGQGLAASANGNAYLLQEGGTTNLVIELNNMPRTNDEEVYQVWLLKNGTRQNAGTLKPDQNGNGLITYRLPQALSFDAIGITLEPNPNNTQPQGQKVMGTS